jgi:hypothetical protein
MIAISMKEKVPVRLQLPNNVIGCIRRPVGHDIAHHEIFELRQDTVSAWPVLGPLVRWRYWFKDIFEEQGI